jgi:hypothetical protein
MSDANVERVEYDDAIWLPREPFPALADFLSARDCLIVMRSGMPPFQVVLGVPHHAAVGEEHICEKCEGSERNRPSDENAALYALVAFTELKDRGVPCKLVIMAHATDHDPNKKIESPYFNEILNDESRLLFECHGSGPNRPLSLEVSAGSNTLSQTVRFGDALASALGYRFTFGVQKRAGGRNARIYNTDGTTRDGKLKLAALRTTSLKEAEARKTHALHLEAKPAFRKSPGQETHVSPEGVLLGRALARAIIQYLDE